MCRYWINGLIHPMLYGMYVSMNTIIQFPELVADTMKGPDRREAALRRELWRVRNSASFRLGNHLIEAARNPIRLLVLPFTLPVVLWSLGMLSLIHI